MSESEPTLSFDEINRQYAGQWLLVRVLKTERDRILEGAVLASDPDREKIAAMLPRAQEQQPRPNLAFFKAK
jgi:hypothetical protein